MEEEILRSRVGMHRTKGCLVVPIQAQLDDQAVLQIQMKILERIKEWRLKGVIIDVSGVDIIDSCIARVISDTARMASLLGATTVVTGLKAGVVSSLVDLGFEPKGFYTALTLEEGFETISSIVKGEHEDRQTNGNPAIPKPLKGDRVCR